MSGSIVQQNSGFANSASSLTATLPSGTTANRTLLIVVASIETITQPAGFGTDASADNPTVGRLRLFRKTAVAGETSWGVTLGGSNGGAWCALEVSGLVAAPLDKTATATGTSTAPSTGTTATTTQADEWAIGIVGGYTSGPAPTFSAWTNSFTEIIDVSSAGTWRTAIGAATRDLTGTGAYSTAATMSQNTFWTGIIATYKAAASAPTGTARFLPFFT